MRKSALLIIHTHICFASMSLNFTDKELILCVNDFITKFYDPETCVSFFSAANDFEERYFMNEIEKTVRFGSLICNNCEKTTFQKFCNMVISAKAVPDLQKLFEVMQKNNVTFGRRVLIISRSAIINPIKDIVNICWRYKVINAVIMIKGTPDINIYNFNPFTHGKCNIPVIYLIGTCKGDKSYLMQDLYKNKANNLNGCPIRLALNTFTYIMILHKQDDDNGYKLSGLEGMLWNIIIKKLNSSIVITFISTHLGLVELAVGKFTAPLRKLQTDEADFACGGFRLTEERFDLFESVTSHCTEYISIAYSLEQPVGTWTRLYAPLQVTVWICIVLILPVFYYITRVKIPIFGIRNYFEFLALFLGYPVASPRVITFKILWVSFIILFFAMVIRTSYQSNLIFFLSGDWREPIPKKLEDFPNQGYKCAMVKNSTLDKELLRDLGLKTEFVIFEKYADLFDALGRGEEKMFALTYKNSLQYFNGTTRRIAPEPVFRLNIGFFGQKSSPYTEEIDKIIQRAEAHGLLSKIIRDAIPKKKTLDDDHTFVIGLKDLKGCFYILFIGLTLSFLVFVCELLYRKFWPAKY